MSNYKNLIGQTFGYWLVIGPIRRQPGRHYVFQLYCRCRCGKEKFIIDNNRGYNPKNCRWATRKEQAQNRKSNLFFEYKGKKYSISELSKILNVKASTLYSRHKRSRPISLS